MIKKVLIAEDYESTNISVQKTLEEMEIEVANHVSYCDDALVRIRKAKEDGDPYDLLITDLYFDEDHRTQQIADGAALVAAVREIQPDLRILVFSAEGKATVIGRLYDVEHVD